MVFLDSNIFIIDRFFPRDNNYSANKKFLEQIENTKAAASIPIYTLFEICGITSFNLSEKEQSKWLYSFSDVYTVEILDPFEDQNGQETISSYLLNLIPYLLKKMTVGDAIFLKEAELYNAKMIITWNKKHFIGRTDIPVQTPEEYLS